MVLKGQTLTPASIFTLLSFMGVLKVSGMLNMTPGLMLTYDAYVSLGRIEEFLLLENLLEASESDESNEPPQKAKSTSGNQSRNYLRKEEGNIRNVSLSREATELGPTILCVSNLSYAKTHREDEFILQDINFFAPSKSLTVITGPVGSGKSTLLSAIAGEISNASGTIDYQGSVIYLPQTAWVFSGTIKENILFGQPFEESKYERIIDVCALKEDFQRLPDGDQTVVGERGEVLSGGQQARVSLARAVYADGDIYLLDDPLSAVDFKVGQHIFNKCIKDLLGDKIVLFASHRQKHMENAEIWAYGFLLLFLKCAERLHDKMVVAILQAPVLFFDSNPVGRILNRFSNDNGCVDELLAKTFLGAMQSLCIAARNVFGIIVTIKTRANQTGEDK